MTTDRIDGSQELPADVATIEREFAALWRATAGYPPERSEGRVRAVVAGDGSERDEPLVTRASSLNLIVPCRGTLVAEVQQVVAELVGSHPARVLLLLLEPDAVTNALTASVSAFCHRLASAPGQVCCEWITLRAQGRGARFLPEAVLPLLEPDLPVVAWWPGGTPLDGPLLGRLSPLVDRWIVDSGASADLSALRRIAASPTLRAGTRKGATYDLAWMRVLAWRELTAQFFDPPAFRAHLPEIDRIEVTATAPGAEPILWIAWLAERLGWGDLGDGATGPGTRPSEARGGCGDGATDVRPQASRCHWEFLGPVGRREARVRLVDRGDLRPGEIGGVRLEASGPQRPEDIRFNIARGSTADHATLTVETTGTCPLPRAVSLPRPRPAQLLTAALDAPGRDPLYAAALSLAARLVEEGLA